MKNVYRVSTKQHANMKSGVFRSKNATILQARCASALSCSNMRKSNWGDWKRETGKPGTKSHGWKTRDRKTWHQIAGVENEGINCMDSQWNNFCNLLK